MFRDQHSQSPVAAAPIRRGLSSDASSVAWGPCISTSGTMMAALRTSGRAEFPGAVDEPRDYLTPGTIYLATSKGEGLSLAMLDAMALGVPVVASAVAGHTDLIRDGENGLLYPWGDAIRAAAQIVGLLEDTSLRQRLAEAAWRTVTHSYRVERMVDDLMKLYEAKG